MSENRHDFIGGAVRLFKKMFDINNGFNAEDLESDHAVIDATNMSPRDIEFQQALTDGSIARDILNEHNEFLASGEYQYIGLGARQGQQEKVAEIIESYFDDLERGNHKI